MGEPILVPFALGIGLKALAAPWWGRNCKIPKEQKLEPQLGSECLFREASLWLVLLDTGIQGHSGGL